MARGQSDEHRYGSDDRARAERRQNENHLPPDKPEKYESDSGSDDRALSPESGDYLHRVAQPQHHQNLDLRELSAPSWMQVGRGSAIVGHHVEQDR